MSEGVKDKATPTEAQERDRKNGSETEKAGAERPNPASPESDDTMEGATVNPAASDASGAAEEEGGNAGEDVAQMVAKLAEAEDRFLRLNAEFENTKKRLAKHHAESLRYALTPLLQDLIGIMDSLEHAVDHARKEPGAEAETGATDASAMVEGIELVKRQLQGVFDKYGMTRIEDEGKPFDPNRHEGIKVVETTQHPPETVVQVMRAGYLLHDRVVRPAMVSVAKRPASAGTA